MVSIRNLIRGISVEPLMLLEGFSYSLIHVYIENLQVERICRVKLGLSNDTCEDLKSDQKASVELQREYSVFALYNSIIAAALPLFFILFMGAWSDKYGRRVPLVAVQIGHALHAGGYLLASLYPSWPVEILLLVTLLDTLGGGTVSFLNAANSYLGDVTSEESRTSRIGLANSIWFLGGPSGTLLGTYIYSKGGYLPLFGTALTLSILALLYTLLCLPESHGPFAQKLLSIQNSSKTKVEMKDSVAAVYGLEVNKMDQCVCKQDIKFSKMVKDFFSLHRIKDSLQSTLKKREGNTRTFILLIIITSLLRRLTRSPYVFSFTRHVLGWDASTYSLWVTYKNLMLTTGSLVAVPLLSGRFKLSDNKLALVGALSGMSEYITYGCMTEAYSILIYIAPVSALLFNSCAIAQRAMMTKFVGTDEIGKVSAVLGALDGMMPLVNSSLYTAIYHASVRIFPAAHFFFGAAVSALMMIMFLVIICNDQSKQYDVEGAKVAESSGPVVNKSMVKKTDSSWLNSNSMELVVVPYQEIFIPITGKTSETNQQCKVGGSPVTSPNYCHKSQSVQCYLQGSDGCSGNKENGDQRNTQIVQNSVLNQDDNIESSNRMACHSAENDIRLTESHFLSSEAVEHNSPVVDQPLKNDTETEKRFNYISQEKEVQFLRNIINNGCQPLETNIQNRAQELEKTCQQACKVDGETHVGVQTAAHCCVHDKQKESTIQENIKTNKQTEN